MKHYIILIQVSVFACLVAASACKPAASKNGSQKAQLAVATDTPRITRWEVTRKATVPHQWNSKITLSNVAQAYDYFPAANRVQIRNYTYAPSASMQLAYNIDFSSLTVADSCNYEGQEQYHEFYIKNSESILQAGEIILKPGKMPPPQQLNKGINPEQLKLSDTLELDTMVIEPMANNSVKFTITLKAGQLMNNITVVRNAGGAYVLLLHKAASGSRTRTYTIPNFNKTNHVAIAAWRSNLVYDPSGMTCYVKEASVKLTR